MTVTVLTYDKVFSDMLKTECAERGASFEPSDISARAVSEKANVAFIDAALYGADLKIPDGCEPVIFGWRDDIEKIGDECEYAIYERPFVVSEILDSAIGVPTLGEGGQKKKKSASDGLRLYSSNHGATYRGEHIKLSKKEFALLSLLVDKKGSVVSRSDAAKIFGDGGDTSNVVDVYIKYLREKIDDRFKIKLITSVRGKGYTIKTE